MFRLNIAATRQDWLNIFQYVEEESPLLIYPTLAVSLADTAPQNIKDIQDLGIAKFGILILEPDFLVVPAAKQKVVREIRQNDGTIRYAIDQLLNPDSFFLRPGGVWHDKCYLIGEITSLSKVGIAADCAKRIRSFVKKVYRRSDNYWIGPQCDLLYSDRIFTVDCRYK